jgi:glucose/arabinose dehydrogenase
MNRTVRILALAGSVALGLAASARAQAIGTVRVADGLLKPLYVTAPKGDPRLFIVEQTTADIKILKNGSVLATPFIDLTPVVNNVGNERGLLGLAFHPNYESNGFFYASFTAGASPGASRVVRYTRSASNPDVADPASAFQILAVAQPFSNHNGGCIQFGPDGYLYIGFGDGGSANDPGCRAQNPGDWMGKMLRIDVDGGSPYAVPATNPFVGVAGWQPEIWSLGWRNPWRFSFDRLNGDIYVGDVGQDAIEEISYQPAGQGGLNYGWKLMEGTGCKTSAGCSTINPPPPCNSPLYTNPIHTINQVGSICSVTGGYVYRGCAMPELQGTYFFADFCAATIWSFKWDGVNKTDFLNRTAELAPGGGLSIASITSFGEDGFGELYICDQGGEIFKIVPDSTTFADCNGNGLEDTCEVATVDYADMDGNNQLDACQSLSVDKAVVSTGFGGVQKHNLHAGASKAGQIYFMLGSASGSAPGSMVDGTHVPLNLDSYTIFTLSAPNVVPLVGSLGLLNGSGQATMNLTVPAGSASVTGLSLTHAYILFTGSVSFASNPVGVTLVP